MCGLRSASLVRTLPPQVHAEGFLSSEIRNPVTSPPLPVPDRFARGRASPKLGRNLFGGRRIANSAASGPLPFATHYSPFALLQYAPDPVAQRHGRALVA